MRHLFACMLFCVAFARCSESTLPKPDCVCVCVCVLWLGGWLGVRGGGGGGGSSLAPEPV